MTKMKLILGASRRWGKYRSGKWESKQDAKNMNHWTHVPAVHEIEVPEAIADGLIQAAAQWATWNSNHDPRGDIRRMVKVEEVEREFKPDPDPPVAMVGMELLEKFTTMLADKMSKPTSRSK